MRTKWLIVVQDWCLHFREIHRNGDIATKVFLLMYEMKSDGYVCI
jgi:hypothetical protein